MPESTNTIVGVDMSDIQATDEVIGLSVSSTTSAIGNSITGALVRVNQSSNPASQVTIPIKTTGTLSTSLQSFVDSGSPPYELNLSAGPTVHLFGSSGFTLDIND